MVHTRLHRGSFFSPKSGVYLMPSSPVWSNPVRARPLMGTATVERGGRRAQGPDLSRGVAAAAYIWDGEGSCCSLGDGLTRLESARTRTTIRPTLSPVVVVVQDRGPAAGWRRLHDNKTNGRWLYHRSTAHPRSVVPSSE